MSIQKASLAAVAVAGLAIALAGCSSNASNSSSSASSSAPATATTTIRVGVTSPTAPPTILPLVAEKLGIAAKYHIAIDFVNISPDVTAQALTTGNVNVLAAPSVEQAILQGAKFRVIAGAAKPYFSLWGKDGSVTSWASLKGKRIGIPAGQDSAAAVLFSSELKQHGLSTTDVILSYGSASGNYDALAAGSVDAAITTPPYTYQLQSSGKFTQIDTMTAAQKGYLSTEFTSSTSFIDAHKPAIADFVEMLQATEKELTTTPISSTILSAVNANLSANGIKPSQFNVQQFLTQLATDGTWQIIPTKPIITADLSLLAQLPGLSGPAKKASFSDIVYEVPGLSDEYNG